MPDDERFRDVQAKKVRHNKLVVAVIVVLTLFAVFMEYNPLVKIGAGERGVVLNFGAVQDTVLGEGLHFIIPIMQRVVKMDVTVQKSQTETVAASADIQETRSTIALNYRIQADRANWVYQNIGIDYKNRIIDPAVQEAVKAVTARYTAVDLDFKRYRVRNEIRDLLKERLLNYNILLVDFDVIDFRILNEAA